MDLQLDGKRALVTGGSKGIGRAIAQQLALEGVHLVIAARQVADLDVAARELSAEAGRRIVWSTVDTRERRLGPGAGRRNCRRSWRS